MPKDKRHFFSLVWPFLLGFLLLTIMGIFSLKLLMGIRCLSVGENLWSKNQKAATFQLLRYLHTADPQSAQVFENCMRIHSHFMGARKLAQHDPGQTEAISQELTLAGMTPEDIHQGVWAQRYFGRTPPFVELFAIWEKADQFVLQLEPLYREIAAYHRDGPLRPDQFTDLASTVCHLEQQTQPRADDFSLKAGQSMHQLYHVLIGATLSILAVLFLGITWRTRRTLRERQGIADVLAVERQRAMVTLAAIGDAGLSVDVQGKIVYMNQAARQLCQIHDNEELSDVCEIIRFQDESKAIVPLPLARLLASDHDLIQDESAHILLCRDGSTVPVSWVASLLRDQGTVHGLILALHDTSREKELIERLGWLAMRDPLSSLYNRRAFEEHLSNALDSLRGSEQERREKVGHILIFVDLDQFKVINDTCGHAAGDELICLVGKKVSQTLREQDMLARMGGDEFGILLSHCSPEVGRQRAEKIRAVIAKTEYTKGANSFSVTASIGMVYLNKPGITLADALSAADLACYKAKDDGRNRVEVYRADDAALATRYSEMAWVSKIQSALEENRFLLYAQAIVPLQHDGAPHFELLLRMRDENGNLVPPGVFIPAAERFGLMPSLDRWVVRQALAKLADLNATEPANAEYVYSINLSGATFCDASFTEELVCLFEEHQVAYSQICLEITETQAVVNFPQAIAFINRMRTLGCSFALDDFGSGMSSFSYLKNLPVDYLKIDGLLVKGMVSSHIDQAMVEMVNHLGHAMRTATVGEYAETLEIVDSLRKSGVDFAQGYALAHPKPWPFDTPWEKKDA